MLPLEESAMERRIPESRVRGGEEYDRASGLGRHRSQANKREGRRKMRDVKLLWEDEGVVGARKNRFFS